MWTCEKGHKNDLPEIVVRIDEQMICWACLLFPDPEVDQTLTDGDPPTLTMAFVGWVNKCQNCFVTLNVNEAPVVFGGDPVMFAGRDQETGTPTQIAFEFSPHSTICEFGLCSTDCIVEFEERVDALLSNPSRRAFYEALIWDAA